MQPNINNTISIRHPLSMIFPSRSKKSAILSQFYFLVSSYPSIIVKRGKISVFFYYIILCSIYFIEEYARKNNFARIRLEVEEYNVRALALYERLGYRPLDYCQMVKELALGEGK